MKTVVIAALLSYGQVRSDLVAVLLAVAIWPRHNHKVSTSILRSNGPHTLDGSRVGWLRLVNEDVQVLVGRTIVIESALVLVVLIMLLVIVLAAQTLGRARPGPWRITTTCSHSRDQVLMTVPGVFRTERSSIGVGNKLVFTFTSRWCGWQSPWDCLLARLCCARARSSVLLVLVCC